MKSHSSFWNTWVYFFIFLFSNTLLSYASLPNSIKLVTILVGVLVPLTMGFRNAFRQKISYTTALESISSFKPSKSFFFIFLGLLLLTRFYRLTSLPFWPINDEGTFASLTLNLVKHWNWDLLQGEAQSEVFFTWICALFFKYTTPSLFTLRFIPSLFSILTGLTAYWASRKYFPITWAFLFSWFCCFSFWAYTLSRFFMPTVLPPLFELTAFGSLGAFLYSKSIIQRWSFFLLTVFTVCLGFYSSITLIVLWASIAFVLSMECFYKKRFNKLFIFLFYILTFLLDWPIVVARLSSSGLSHIRQSWGGFFPWITDLTYLKALFWDGQAGYPFGSDWGGLFNPLLVSLIFVGFIYIFQIFDFYILLCATICFIFSLAPGFLSGSLEIYRITNSFIFFMAAATWGIFALFPDKSKTTFGLIILFLICSTGLDIYNFIYCYSDIRTAPPRQQWRSVEYFNAYQILKHLNERNGPLDVFTEWNTDYDNKTLDIACYTFNALDNPKILKTEVSWLAFTVNLDYTPFLKNNFPHVRSRLLNPGLPPGDLHHSLGVFLIPVSDISPAVLSRWMETQKKCEEIDFAVKNKNPKKPWSIYEREFSNLASQQKNDRFLSSILWERAASFILMDGDFRQSALDFKQAVQKGYPAPHLLHNLNLANSLAHSPAQNIQKSQ